MKKISIIALISLVTLHCSAQTADTATFKATGYFKEVQQAAKNQKLWKAELYGRMLFVEPKSRTTWSNTPDSAGILKFDGGIYKGILPTGIIIANTAITWEGKLWSVVIWPIYGNHDDQLSSLLHESFHRIQDQIGLPSNNVVDEHLSTMNGRIYFLLEMQALKTALGKPVNQRKNDLTNALLFREKRHLLFPETFGNIRK